MINNEKMTRAVVSEEKVFFLMTIIKLKVSLTRSPNWETFFRNQL